jgi:hypothetical protein
MGSVAATTWTSPSLVKDGRLMKFGIRWSRECVGALAVAEQRCLRALYRANSLEIQGEAVLKKAFDANGIKFAYPTVQVAGASTNVGDEAVTATVAQKGLELVKPATSG